MKNAIGREVPEFIEGYGPVRQFKGADGYKGTPSKADITPKHKPATTTGNKLYTDLDALLDKLDLHDGMTISFHHHLRNGDYVTNMVMLAIAKRGIKDIHLAPTGLFGCHDPLVPLIEDGTITQISVSTFGPGGIAKAISAGKLKKPAVMRSHGGRPRAIEDGELHIDLTFVAAPACDKEGNLNGSHGPSACGCLSYIYADTEYADCVVAVTDNLVDYPCQRVEITEDHIDYVLKVDALGDPNGIASGAMKVTEDPARLAVAERAAQVIDAAGYIKDGMSFQTGVGAISLAVADKVRTKMRDKKVKGSFGSGGISGFLTDMLEEGLFDHLWDVQSFDTHAIKNLSWDDRHWIMSGSKYGNPERDDAVVNGLDVMILGTFEIDVDFNCNVITGSNGVIMSSHGGNPDTAAGSKICIIVSDLMKKGPRCLVKKACTTVSTPGESIDVLVTDKGIAVNPRRTDIIEACKKADLPLIDIAELQKMGEELGAIDDNPQFTDRIVGVVEYRDGSVIDVVRQLAPKEA